MSSLNKVQLIGNLTRDPELKQLPSGANLATIGVATNRKWKDKNSGETQEEVEFHNISCWGRLAEICGQWLKKGAKVYFEGRLKTRNWEDPDGKKNYRTEIIAENMIMLDSKGAEAPPPSPSSNEIPPNAGTKEAQKEASKAVGGDEETKIDDLPF